MSIKKGNINVSPYFGFTYNTWKCHLFIGTFQKVFYIKFSEKKIFFSRSFFQDFLQCKI